MMALCVNKDDHRSYAPAHVLSKILKRALIGVVARDQLMGRLLMEQDVLEDILKDILVIPQMLIQDVRSL